MITQAEWVSGRGKGRASDGQPEAVEWLSVSGCPTVSDKDDDESVMRSQVSVWILYRGKGFPCDNNHILLYMHS